MRYHVRTHAQTSYKHRMSKNKPIIHPAGHVFLSSSCTVAMYRKLEQSRDQKAIANFIEERFTERYLSPIQVDPSKKNGFTIMAVSCVMVEAIECFARGWGQSNGRSRKAFRGFFSRWPAFESFVPVADQFYEHVRCGILHQAETTGGWRIRRSGPLLSEKTINATAFANALHFALRQYADQLRADAWQSEIWIALREKMRSICENAES